MDVRKADISIQITPARLRSFLSNIEKANGDEGCWVWNGGVNRDGYGSYTRFPAHRVAYEWLVGPIPAGLQLDHLCRTPACVNPHHLEPVERAENRKRVQRVGPWQLQRYCRRGHALVGDNARLWSDGRGGREIRCYVCHDGKGQR